MKLTDMALQKLSAPETGAKVYADDNVPHFGVKVTQNGAKSFILTVGRERKRITIGRYVPGVFGLAQAREKARKILAERELGIERKVTPTFKAILTEYLARRTNEVRASTQQADGYLFKRVAHLDRRKLDEITGDDIEAVIDAIDAPSTKRSVYIRLSGVFSYAVRKGYIERSPVSAVEIPPDQAPRQRVLTDDELRKVLTVARALRTSGDQYGAIIELLVYTGQRARQISGLHRSEVDFDNGVLVWGPERMKKAKRHIIPMSDFVRERLQEMNAERFYFPNSAGGTFCGWGYHFRKFTREVGFSDWVLHDIRRALASRWAATPLSIPIATTERMLSHSAITGGLVGVYQVYEYLAEMREAVLRWEQYLHTLCDECS